MQTELKVRSSCFTLNQISFLSRVPRDCSKMEEVLESLGQNIRNRIGPGDSDVCIMLVI